MFFSVLKQNFNSRNQPFLLGGNQAGTPLACLLRNRQWMMRVNLCPHHPLSISFLGIRSAWSFLLSVSLSTHFFFSFFAGVEIRYYLLTHLYHFFPSPQQPQKEIGKVLFGGNSMNLRIKWSHECFPGWWRSTEPQYSNHCCQLQRRQKCSLVDQPTQHTGCFFHWASP